MDIWFVVLGFDLNSLLLILVKRSFILKNDITWKIHALLIPLRQDYNFDTTRNYNT